MSARHSRTGAIANDLHNGTCYVPSMGWIDNKVPSVIGPAGYPSYRGRHRCECPPDPMGFDCPHVEHRESLGL